MVLPWVPTLAPSLPTCLWKSFKSRPFSLPPHPPPMAKVCRWYLCHPEGKTQSTITTTINSQDPHIQFAIEESNQAGTLPFLDTLFVKVPTTLQLPLSTENQHTQNNIYIGTVTTLSQPKNSVFNTLTFRPKVVCTSQQILHKEMELIKKALQACNFLPWALHTPQNKFNCKHNIYNGQTTTGNQPNNTTNNNNKGSNNKNISVVVPYIDGLGRKIWKGMQKLGDKSAFQRD